MTARDMRRWLRRDPWENAASIVIGLGVVMLMQPFSLWLFGHSLAVILIGTIGFMIVSHFPEEPLAAEDGDG
jgi:hypothetical protein